MKDPVGTVRLGVVLIGAALLAACGLRSTGGVEFPYGRFESTGQRYLEFHPDGTFDTGLLSIPARLSGTFEVEGDRIIFGPETLMSDELAEEDFAFENMSEAACETRAAYRWTLDGDRLSFEPDGEDACERRPFDLVATFHRVE